MARLRLLSVAKDPSTFALLHRLRPWRGVDVLDIGCGIGSVTHELARLSCSGSVLGLDPDARVIEEAQVRSSSAEFVCGYLDDLPGSVRFDRIYARYVVSHQTDPMTFLQQAKGFLKAGGMLIVEDIDFDGHVCWPSSPSFDRYVELFKAVVSMRGGDACIGPKLPRMFEAAGLTGVSVDEVTPMFRSGSEMQVAAITLRHVSESILEQKLIEKESLGDLVSDLEQHCGREDVLVSLARTFQVWGVS
ncbi:MAG TPA: methyltransferase domain-containing protein [Fimbriimonas sp.]|nr:methyltransferase domain-containing protein [Fimbriimonas sp.]